MLDNSFLAYLRGIETSPDEGGYYAAQGEFLAYLRGIETVPDANLKTGGKPFLAYLRGIETMRNPCPIAPSMVVFSVPTRD